MKTMTARERCIKAMNFEPTDRLPIMCNGVRPPFVSRLLGTTEDQYWDNQAESHYEAMRRLGQDFHIQVGWFPVKVSKNWAQSTAPAWNDVEEIVADLEKTAADFLKQKADLENNREERIRKIMDFQVDQQAQQGEEILWIFGMGPNGPLGPGLAYSKYGYEGFFLAVAMYPDVVAKYNEAQALLNRVHNECVVEAADRLQWPKIGYLGSDMTTQRGNMVSPKIMDEILFPYLDMALKPLVDDGFKIIWHSDGNMNDMIGPLIDIGIAGFQGFQEECGTHISEVAKLRNRNGDPLILWGSCSAIDVLRNGSFDDIRKEVQRVIDEWPHPGLCLATSSYIDNDVPDENIIEYYRLCRELGKIGAQSRR